MLNLYNRDPILSPLIRLVGTKTYEPTDVKVLNRTLDPVDFRSFIHASADSEGSVEDVTLCRKS